ncbi:MULTISPECIES: hypothetical protein [Pseudonocardia]|uniref:Uncharacterized protein n=2 Tax=Pseudonocardia TaxID=1847 RepID=A0A1Y2MWZ7_PSEAH|nr:MULTISPECIES: hypothetical protein [Pseudonocardia]OSY39682.1 hypothetical protein BG845_03279 [Pseudonocardia autotrophica]TDN72812.1 hypothetical protein C8E95_1877 [Pseudonocardia autotrophica]BBG03529.1 hypothetical protein Pdca_47380 [Pseudonocardia autotrophica]GEC24949.1 hypothetical protein PSA01_19780 [Pseudonocardia saturnea]
MRCGIYPGGPVGGDGEIIGPIRDDPPSIDAAIARLRGSQPFHVRAYAHFTDERAAADVQVRHPDEPRQYLNENTRLDLVLQYQSVSGDIAGFCAFVERMIAEYGPVLGAVQIGEEANVTDNPVLDGAFTRVLEAVGSAIPVAKNATRRSCPEVLVGTNTTQLMADPHFYQRLLDSVRPDVAGHLDYVGLDAFPDVFAPLPPNADLAAVCTWLLLSHRTDSLAPAGLGDVPIHLTEHGWPTGPSRSVERQSEVLDAMFASAVQPSSGVTSYTHFSLRDASDDGSFFGGFGLMTSDYSPKPAFHRYRHLVHHHAT